MFDSNPTGEAQILASDGTNLVVFPRQGTHKIKLRLAEIRHRRLTFLAIAVFNFSPSYVFGFPHELLNYYGLGIEVEMKRRKSREFKNKIDAVFYPAETRYIPLADFEVLKPFLLLES